MYNTLYVKELDNMDELFENETTILKYVKYFFKKIFCILTITKENICIIPYKKLNIPFVKKLITKLLIKSTKNVVLSKYLESIPDLKNNLNKADIHIYDGKILANYLLHDFVEYISKIREEEVHSQEINLLINTITAIDEQNIIYLANHCKRINIVTSNIRAFRKIEKYLEENFGVSITVTNNKRKSLIKAKIIVNFDFCEEIINSFQINPNAIIFSFNNNANIKSKLFNGINIYDYQITYNQIFQDIMYKKFDKKILYESTIITNNYNGILEKIRTDNVKIVNLVGKNGIINIEEYKRI